MRSIGFELITLGPLAIGLCGNKTLANPQETVNRKPTRKHQRSGILIEPEIVLRPHRPDR